MTKLCHISTPKIMLKCMIIKLTRTASLFIKKFAPIPSYGSNVCRKQANVFDMIAGLIYIPKEHTIFSGRLTLASIPPSAFLFKEKLPP